MPKIETLYVKRDVLNGADIVAWAKAAGFPTTIPAEDMHVTLVYSKKPVDWEKAGWLGGGHGGGWSVDTINGGAREIAALGDKGEAIVLLINYLDLDERHWDLIDIGASSDFPGYKPHITITWNAGDFDWRAVEPYRGPITLGPEVFQPVKGDWKAGLVEDYDPDEPRDPAGKWTFFHGGKDFDKIDPARYGSGEPGGIRPLGQGLYGGVALKPADLPTAIELAKIYAKKYGGTLHGFEVNLNDPRAANIGYGGDKWSRGGLGVEVPNAPRKRWQEPPNQIEYEVLPWMHGGRHAVEGSVMDPSILGRIGKWPADTPTEDIVKAVMGRREIKDATPSNDPTETGDIRARFLSDLRKRWITLKAMTREAIEKGGVATPLSDDVSLFSKWFAEALVQTVVGGSGRWSSKYIGEAYALGAARAAALTKPAGDQISDRVTILSTVTAAELAGVCATVAQQATRAVGAALLAHARPAAIVKQVLAVIDDVGVRRAAMVVNHMVVKSFSSATLQSFRAAGLTQVGTVPERVAATHVHDAPRKTPQKRHKKSGKFVAYSKSPGRRRRAEIEQSEQLLAGMGEVDVLTAEDDKVCPICQSISDNGPYDIDKAEGLIPAHPNCRCVFVPAGSIDLK